MSEKQNVEEIAAEELPSKIDRYITVSYYGGSMPYITTHDSLERAVQYNKEGNTIYKLWIPTKKI